MKINLKAFNEYASDSVTDASIMSYSHGAQNVMLQLGMLDTDPVGLEILSDYSSIAFKTAMGDICPCMIEE